MVNAGDETAKGDPYTLCMDIAPQWQIGSMADETAEILRERIVEGRLAPQERLTQRRLADDLNVTRAVAGEALRMLHREGLLDNTAGVMRVAQADGAKLLAAYAVREMIDGVAARLAAQNAGPGTERRCQEALNDHRKAIDAGDRLRCMRADISFHAGLVEGSGNSVLRSHWLLLRFTTRSAMLLTAAQLRDSYEEHAAILTAVRRSEPEDAELTARAHVRATSAALTQLPGPHELARKARAP
jgi:DNA-binding GntR family transcriptional regulator